MAIRLSQVEHNHRKQMYEQGYGWCSKCKQFKSLTDFSANKRHYFGYHSWCKVCHSHSRKGNKIVQRKARNQARSLTKYYTDLAGGCCQKCGYNRSWFALDFHHVNPAEKLFSVSQRTPRYDGNNESIVVEINKCVLLCSNCHREYESGLWMAEFVKREKLGWTINQETIKEIDIEIIDRYLQRKMEF